MSAAKQRLSRAAVFERSEFCRSSRGLVAVAEKLFSAPLGLLVLFGPRKEHPPHAPLWKHVQDPCSAAGRRVLSFTLKVKSRDYPAGEWLLTNREEICNFVG